MPGIALPGSPPRRPRLVRVEIAVGALAHAPRKVHVERQRRQRRQTERAGPQVVATRPEPRLTGRSESCPAAPSHQRHAAQPLHQLAQCQPRWLMRFFSSGASSAALQPQVRHEEQRVVAEAAAAARLAAGSRRASAPRRPAVPDRRCARRPRARRHSARADRCAVAAAAAARRCWRASSAPARRRSAPSARRVRRRARPRTGRSRRRAPADRCAPTRGAPWPARSR